MPVVMNEKPSGGAASKENQVAGYEAPRIETVLTADDVEREALYGGISMQP